MISAPFVLTSFLLMQTAQSGVNLPIECDELIEQECPFCTNELEEIGILESSAFEPPLVELRSAHEGCSAQFALTSLDDPSHWIVVQPCAIEITVKLFTGGEQVEWVEMLLDGEPLSNCPWSMCDTVDSPEAIGWDRIYKCNMPCPTLGRHVLQARYKIAGTWSAISKPLRFDVQPIAPPEIVSVSDIPYCSAVPISSDAQVKLRGRRLYLRLSNVSQDESVLVYLDGKEVACAIAKSCDCYVDLPLAYPPGAYSLTVRRAPKDSCGVASEFSKEVVVRFDPREGYATSLGPCENSTDTSERKWGDRIIQLLRDPLSTAIELAVSGFYAAPEAFSEIPTARQLPEQGERDTANLSLRCPKQNCVNEFRFFDSAEFPIREFAKGGHPIDREGAIIYEGMRFSVGEDGRYEVSFLVGTPNVPTTLNLQLLVRAPRDSNIYTVTLPPITIRPEEDSPTRSIYRIEHCGYSPALRNWKQSIIQGDTGEVRRSGTATFGFGFGTKGDHQRY